MYIVDIERHAVVSSTLTLILFYPIGVYVTVDIDIGLTNDIKIVITRSILKSW